MPVRHLLRVCSELYGTQVSCYVHIDPVLSVMPIMGDMLPVKPLSGSVAPDSFHSDSWVPVSARYVLLDG